MADVELAPTAPGGPVAPDATAEVAAPRSRWIVWFVAVALLVLIFDQLAKYAIRVALPHGSIIDVIPGWVHWSHVLNHGAAWGIFSGQRPMLIAVALGVMVLVGFIARDIAPRGALACGGLAMILGGALGNLLDRVMFGAVTDFIDLDTPIQWLHDFPVFNVADSALTVGVIMVALDYIISTFREARAESLAAQAAAPGTDPSPNLP